jgi:hypothetical protein
MTREEFKALHETLCKRAFDLMVLKNQDYGGNTDPFANFRMSALLHLKPALGVLLRMQDKMARLISFIEKGELKVTKESWDDACVDVLNYTIILAGLLYEETRE